MSRPILGKTGASSSWVVPTAPRTRSDCRVTGPQLDQRLRRVRSKAYRDAMHVLDAGAHHADPNALRSLLDAIAAEFPDLHVEDQPLGIVAVCHLGRPFEVHICDFAGMIVEHFPVGRSMPGPFERARSIALHPAYEFVEVYPKVLRAVSHHGVVSVLER